MTRTEIKGILIRNKSMFNLNTSITELPRIGVSGAKKLKRLNILTVKDLLYHFPWRHDDYRQILTIARLKAAGAGVIRGKIKVIANKRSPQKRMIITEAIVSDETDSVKIVWFNQPFLTRIIKAGTELYLGGKMEKNEYYGLELSNPSYEIYKNKTPVHFGRLVPIYPLTSRLSQKQLRFLIRTTLFETKILDWLPYQIKYKYHLVDLSFALHQIHFPKDLKSKNLSLERLKFDELFLIQLRNEIMREKIKKQKAPLIKFKLKETQNFVNNLPFRLSDEQRKVAWQILKDLEKDEPMNRLLQGEVGSGKTVVATIAILNVILNNYQVSYLAPTEILASQQFKNISSFLKTKHGNFWPGKKIALFTKNNLRISQKKVKRPELLKKLASGKIDLIIGTHALIQKEIKFSRLGLIVVDEQHRFGVAQRQFLLASRHELFPHFLSMTATPIPRSLALVLHGNLDISLIKEKLPGRKEVETKIVKPEEKEEVYQFIREEIKKGRQGFIICPLIDPSDPSSRALRAHYGASKLDFKSVKEEEKKLSRIFSEFKIGLLHGKLKAEEKDKIMKDFKKNKINLLVSTTVVEVGIDIPNTSIMMIENAERFGLAQLYQLRGRIGRGSHQSYCFLILDEESQSSYLRLKALIEAKNSLELAEKDLSQRGPGKIYNYEQSGFLEDFKLARFTDTDLIKKTKEAARLFLPLFQKKISALSLKGLDKIVYLE